MSDEKVIEKKNVKIVPIILGIIIAVVIAVVAVIFATANNPEKKLSKSLDLGAKYLDEGNYEQAIAAFDVAISIDPKNVDAYLGKAEAYIGLGDYDSAIETLVLGYKETEDKKLKKELQKVVEEYVAELVDDGDVDDAIKLVEDVQDDIGDDIFEKLIEEIGGSDEDDTTDEDDKLTEVTPVEDGEYVLVREVYYNSDGSVSIERTFEYDEQGRETVRTENGMRQETDYDSEGNKTVVFYEADGSVRSSTYYEYDSNGNLVSMTSQNSSGDETGKMVYEYNTAGSEIKCSTYMYGGLAWYYENELNGSGDVAKRIYYTNSFINPGSWEVESYNEYEYDAAGNMISETCYYSDGYKGSWTTNEYDANGNLTKSNTTYDDGNSQQWEYEYSPQNLMVKSTFPGGWAEYEYELLK